ncbi:MAG: hypothetical protein Unbinned3907contig1000_36 [Prokaryotic dsDNA virus sp.]|nr:MAG: hypothetical protein Unbinned3907contig1000_36 [Prokaryotic dsDNA virus sp.]
MSIYIRASALGCLMVEPPSTKISEKQLLTLEGLLSKIKLTEKQAEHRDYLLSKRDALPSLSAGAKTFVKELWLEKNYGIKKTISNKYIDKGNEVENLSIKLAETMLDLGKMEKNQKRYENDFICGTPDVITKTHIVDVKSSWSAVSFPFFDDELKNKGYEWQMKSYMWLTGIHKSYLCYCLVPTPELIIEDEIRRVSWSRGEGSEVSQEVEDEVRSFHDLSQIPAWERIKSFEVILTDEDIEKMKQKVILAREYYNTLK